MLKISQHDNPVVRDLDEECQLHSYQVNEGQTHNVRNQVKFDEIGKTNLSRP